MSRNHRDLHSFPTRRSSDLEAFVGHPPEQERIGGEGLVELELVTLAAVELERPASVPVVLGSARVLDDAEDPRSEEHTSELQSQFHLVCRLLLEKKNHHHVL